MKTLYEKLMTLCENSEAFFFKDHRYSDGGIYRIFNYRLASYTEFLTDGALECRGIMYDITGDIPVMVSRPMTKFFNWKENPFTEDLDLSQVDFVMDKRDGSLISTFYTRDNTISLKSKASLFSEQATDAMEYLSANEELMPIVQTIIESWNCTVNFEWTSPKNRVVVPYQSTDLIILNVRDNGTGMYISPDRIIDETGIDAGLLSKYWVDIEYNVDGETFVPSIAGMCADESQPVIEGYVIQLKDGTQFKCKTERYIRLHRTKDDITNPKRLFDLVIHEQTDDLRSLFHYDEYLMGVIDDMERTVEPRFNHMINVVEQFYENNSRLDRKDYAIKGQSEMSYLFPLVMQMYVGKDIDYKAFALKNMEKFL